MKEWSRFIQDGNLDALSYIYFHYYDLLFTYGMKHGSEKQSVEDSIQDVFMNLIKYRKTLGVVNNLTGYLVSTFRRHLFLMEQKRRQTSVAGNVADRHFEFFKTDDQDLQEKENLEQMHETIRLCIGKLSSKQQEIIYLRFENNISYEEIAEMLQISVDSCYKSVYRSIKAIRQEVGTMNVKGGNIILIFLSKMTM